MKPLRPTSTPRSVGRLTGRTRNLERRDTGNATTTDWVEFEEPYALDWEWPGGDAIKPAWKKNPNPGKHPFLRGAVTGGVSGTSPFTLPSEAGAPFDGTNVSPAALTDGSNLAVTTIDADGVVTILTFAGATQEDLDDAISALSSVYQPLDSDLSAFAGLSIAADKLPYGTGSHTLGLTDLTSFIRTLLDDSDAATARATLGVIKALFQSGGAQAIKLDDLAAADDNTDLDASASAHGLLPKLDGSTTHFLRGDGAWSTPSGGGGGGTAADVQTFDAGTGQTWTKPGGSPQMVEVICIGAGGGGGGGAASVSTLRSGGSGGGGGSVTRAMFQAADLTGTVTVDVGAGGAGGSGGAAGAGANGGNASDGSGPSSFGSYLAAYPGGGGRGGLTTSAAGGAGGSVAEAAVNTSAGSPAASTNAIGGQGAQTSSGAAGSSSEWGGASGGGASTSNVRAGGSSVFAGPAGGNGGNVGSGNVGAAGGAGGTTRSYTAGGGGTAGTGGGTPTDGGDGSAFSAPYCGGGGGGGGGGSAVAGKTGGDGGRGAGGGGGGSSSSATSSAAGGAGGAGGAGRVIVITYF